MKKNFNYIIGFALLLAWTLSGLANPCNANNNPEKKQNKKQAKQIAKMLSKLSLEDKVGEMTQLTLDMLSVGEPFNLKKPHELDEQKLQEVLVDLKVGSILNCGGHSYTREYWHEIIDRIQEVARQKESKIPVLYGIDAIHGTNYTRDATLFPQQIALAATWNTNLAESMGRVTAYETRASAIPWNFSPVLDIGRDPRWPRLWETFGEDVLLARRMGTAMIKGYQGDDLADSKSVAATMKHFLGYSITLTGKDRTQAWIPNRYIKEYYQPIFQDAIDAGAASVMINSGEINGIPVHCNPDILQTLLRDEMGFEGVAVTDWEDIKYLHSRHKVAASYKDAIAMSINAGIDLSMVPIDTEYPKLLKELVEEGVVPMSRIDEAVTRILQMKMDLGLFEKTHFDHDEYPDFASEKHRLISLEATREAITLLKNEGNLLPLSKDTPMLLCGPTANSLNYLNGGWTHTWQGADSTFNHQKPTIAEAMKAEFQSVSFVSGAEMKELSNKEAIIEAAKKAKVAVVCLGESTYTEKPGDLDDLDLPAAQKELVKMIAEQGTRIVLVLVEGRPRLVHEIEPLCDAVVMAYLPGNEGAQAISEVLAGKVNPSGKLPFTYPRFANSLLTYDHKHTDRISQTFSLEAFQPQWEFGHGLSYTKFDYGKPSLSSSVLEDNKAITVSVELSNTGEQEGKETVQLFVSDEYASVTPSVKRLRGFEKIGLKKGESKVVEFKISTRDLAFVNKDNEWSIEQGDFTLHIGPHSLPFTYNKSEQQK